MKKSIKRWESIHTGSFNRGITLVALIVTIVVLLVLAGISIASLTGNSLFEKAKLAKEKQKNAQEQEDAILGEYENTIGQYVDGTREQIMVDREEYEQLKAEVQQLKQNSIKFIDYSRVLTNITSNNISWTATEDCAVIGSLKKTDSNSPVLYIDNVPVLGIFTTDTGTSVRDTMYVEKGSVIKTREYGEYDLVVYGLK